MNNNELEIKIKEIINTSNYFDMVIKAGEFESEYKKSNFYKITKKSLAEVIKESKLFYTMNWESIVSGIQNIIDNLDAKKVMEVINELGELFANENSDIYQSIAEMKTLLGEIKD
jgi:deoxyribose-phosphate aldolase